MSGNRSRLMMAGVIGVVAALGIAALTYRLWRPLFVDDVVSEEFPEAAPAEESLPPAPADAVEEPANPVEEEGDTQSAPPEATAQDLPAADDAMAGATALVMGQFNQIDSIHGGSGSATVYQLADGAQILRLENFTVTNGPDLFVVLSRHPNPTTAEELGDYLDLGMLKGNVGDQNYDLAPGFDVSPYASAVIYCKEFEVIFSVATFGG